MYGPWAVRTKSPGSCDAIVTCALPVLCVFLRFLAQYSMTRTCTTRVSEGSAGPCRRLTGFGTTYGQSCRPVGGKYRAYRIHMYGRLLFGPRTTLYEPKIVGSPSLKAVHAHLSATGYTARTSPKMIEKCTVYRSAVIRPVWSWFSLCTKLANKDTNFFIRTVESNKTELAALAISVLSCTGSHISCYVFSQQLHTLKQTELKPCFEAMSNEMKTKMLHILTMCFIVTDWAHSGIYKE